MGRLQIHMVNFEFKNSSYYDFLFIFKSKSHWLEKNSNSIWSLSSRIRTRIARAIERVEFEYINTQLEQTHEPNKFFILIYFFIILIIYKKKSQIKFEFELELEHKN